jgi:TonB family protein
MESVINNTIESVICGLFGYFIYEIVISRYSNYAYRRLFLLTAATISLVFPLIKISVSDPVISEFLIDPVYVVNKRNTGQVNGAGLSGYTIIMMIYTLPVLINLLLILLDYRKIYKIRKESEIVKRDGLCKIYVNPDLQSPFSFGNSLYISSLYCGQERDMIISHELSHIVKNHSVDIVVLNIIKSFLWFNPFIYLIKDKLCEIHEFQADRDVLINGANLEAYQQLLLYSNFGVAPDISNSFHKSLTFKRFNKMENLKQSKAGTGAVVLFSAVIILLFSITAFSKATDPVFNNELISPFNEEFIPQEKSDTVKKVSYEKVDIKPKFQGTDSPIAFVKWVMANISYPEKAKKDTIQGKVFVQFLIDENGKVGNVKIVKGVNKELDSEAHRVISSSPDWEPGSYQGKKVKVLYNLPIIFKLQ